ncbi:hypothetical protein Pan44_37670 [Caulifigura coniformis]|uniref:Lipocalin-like domain-containing protein n=1 Tax=Caulifigura coniformis TaxID=2527983 RepID=A0A517SHX4_9PLAN|nr:hypothetical protein [Caulifigura coniformis]QDT55721.1 hypothetical protein Pan44_37670 [Caulifigura coniformis]
MINKTPEPKRKRRRWTIAGALLLMAAAAGWWYWPRGDARFVGTWEVFQDFQSHPEQNSPKPIQSVTFYANGTARVVRPGSNPITMLGAWRVEGDELQLGYQIPIRWRSTAVTTARRIAKVTGRYLLVYEWGNRVSFSHTNEFRVHDRDEKIKDGFFYRRVPE